MTLSGESDVSIGSVLRHGDVNGDKIEDLILGYSKSRHPVPERAMMAVHVIDGARQWSAQMDLADGKHSGHKITAGGSSPYLWSVTATDINGDEYADIVLECLNTSYVLLGGSKRRPAEINILNTDWPMIKIDTQQTLNIYSMNLNNDEFQDLVITHKPGSQAKAYIIYGGLQYNFLH